MTNPILQRVQARIADMGTKAKAGGEHAGRYAKVNAKIAKRHWDKFPAHSKVGLTFGGTSLALGISNTMTNRFNANLNKDRVDLENKSLEALKNIHKAIEKKE